MQNGQSIRGPSTAVAGGTIEIEIGMAGDVSINLGGPNGSQTIPVPAAGKVTIPVPPGAGPYMTVSVGKGWDRKFLIIEIVSPSP